MARRRELPHDPSPGSAWLAYSGVANPPEAADAAAIVAADLGACLARKHWSNVLAIVRAVDPKAENIIHWGSGRAKAARRREAAAVDSQLDRIIPSIAGCTPAGTKLRMNRPRLRSLLEETAWQMISGGPEASDGR